MKAVGLHCGQRPVPGRKDPEEKLWRLDWAVCSRCRASSRWGPRTTDAGLQKKKKKKNSTKSFERKMIQKECLIF